MNTDTIEYDKKHNLKELENSLKDFTKLYVNEYVQYALKEEYDNILSNFSDIELRNEILKHFKNCIMEFVDENLKEV